MLLIYLIPRVHLWLGKVVASECMDGSCKSTPPRIYCLSFNYFDLSRQLALKSPSRIPSPVGILNSSIVLLLLATIVLLLLRD